MPIKVITPTEQAYIPLPKRKLLIGSRLPFEITIKEGAIYKQYLETGSVYTAKVCELLDAMGISEVYVPEIYQAALKNYLNDVQRTLQEQVEQKALKQYSSKKDEYIQIDKGLLFIGKEIPFSIHVMNFNRCAVELKTILNASEKNPAKVTEFTLSHQGDFLVHREDIHLYNEYVKNLPNRQDLPSEEKNKVKAIAIKENSKLLMKELLANPRSGEAVKKSEELVDDILNCILESKDAIYNLLSLKNYDYYTYTHCVNVAVMSIGLGNLIGLSKDEITCLGKGAMLHDIGKSAISPEILNKQGKLDETEYKIIQSHVIEGVKILQSHKIDPKCMPAVEQHHEKISGRGYPYKLKGNEIQLFGRISSIADCYDALTTKRPYKNAFSPFHALSIIAKETGDFDPELLKLFIKMLGKVE